ncbi:holo-ACP synthase [bacterium]|nr:holo-ACP synthase [bacterium]
MKDLISIGTDIEDISRFKNKTIENSRVFLEKIYTQNELAYCFKTALPEQHLCARFCAKEAVIKALSDFKIDDVFYKDIEILNRNGGAPYVVLNKYPNLQIKVSISHCKTYATATVLAIRD